MLAAGGVPNKNPFIFFNLKISLIAFAAYKNRILLLITILLLIRRKFALHNETTRKKKWLHLMTLNERNNGEGATEGRFLIN